MIFHCTRKMLEKEGTTTTTEGCCFSSFMLDSYYFDSNNRQISKEQSIVLKEIEDDLKGNNSTTAKAREHIANQIIGLGVQEIDESEEFVNRHMGLLKKEITKTTGSIRTAYDLAMKMNSNFVTNKKFRIMFLRADEFDAKKAARRMMFHFKYKLDLFGENKLVKEITFDDLCPTDQAFLLHGSLQYLLGVKDKWGRHVAFQFCEQEQNVSWEHSARAHWYQAMVGLQDEQTQKRGIVMVSVGSLPAGAAPIVLRRFTTLLRAIPMRPKAVHKYIISPHLNPYLITTALRAVISKFRLRTRFHVEESVTSFLYSLFLYGVDPAKVPLDDNGQPQTETFREAIKKQKLLERQQHKQQQQQQQQPRPKHDHHITKVVVKQGVEEEEEEKTYRTTTSTAIECFHSDTGSIIASSSTATTSTTTTTTTTAVTTKRDQVIPTIHDVLLGKGKKNPYFQGNTILDKMIEMEAISYKKATSQFDKTCIVLMTIKRMESIGGRFLKLCGEDNSNNNSSNSNSSSRIGNSKNRNNNDEEKGCILATDQEIRDTVSSRLRNKARKIKAF